MEQEERQIELRSEKVRNLIGQIPPLLIRYGTLMIGIALLVMVGVSAFIPYQQSVEAEIYVTQGNTSTLDYSICIPQNVANKRLKTARVVSVSSELPLPTHFQIENISDTIWIDGQNVCYTAILRPVIEISERIVLEKPISISGKILLEKKSVLMWVMGKILKDLKSLKAQKHEKKTVLLIPRMCGIS